MLLCAGPSMAQRGTMANFTQKTIDVAGTKRTYLLHVPADFPTDRPAPLVFVFHGGGSTAAGTERLTRFSRLADRERIIVVFPEALGMHWNDGREAFASTSHRDNVDDVG